MGPSASTDPWTMATIAGLACVTVVARSFFFMSSKPWTLPRWAQRGLQYAPIAAMSAVVLPEVLMAQGQLLSTWKDARLFAALAGVAYFYGRAWIDGKPGHRVLGAMISGMVVYLPLHLGLGW